MALSCQLANNYYPTKNYGVSSWWSSPKLDGVRGLYLPTEQAIFSRTLKSKFVGLDHILDICNQQGYILDGELYIPGEPFDVISGIVRGGKSYDLSKKQRLQFHIFAILSIETREWLNAQEMIDTIPLALPPSSQSIIVANPYTLIENNPTAIQSQNQFNKDSGLSNEGTILRHPDIAYSEGRSNDLLKVKNFEKNIFICTGFFKGTGKYSQSLGKISVQSNILGVPVAARVGTGFTDAERLEIWNNQSNYRGRQLEVIHLGLTKTHSIRHPVFSKFI
ncbi:ATP-dependent DNA ligase [Planktothrix agardhii]|uniref:DNA ligase n=1 Tax=Planktothrix agardhii TaxID=1160 RepID=A0AAD1Q7H3_PLAAG|nr:RNA ligase family protein [Planktothrix agardhii]CAD5984430.1 DNA ligase [Planktothrix agardhii]